MKWYKIFGIGRAKFPFVVFHYYEKIPVHSHSLHFNKAVICYRLFLGKYVFREEGDFHIGFQEVVVKFLCFLCWGFYEEGKTRLKFYHHLPLYQIDLAHHRKGNWNGHINCELLKCLFDLFLLKKEKENSVVGYKWIVGSVEGWNLCLQSYFETILVQKNLSLEKMHFLWKHLRRWRAKNIYLIAVRVVLEERQLWELKNLWLSVFGWLLSFHLQSSYIE